MKEEARNFFNQSDLSSYCDASKGKFHIKWLDGEASRDIKNGDEAQSF